MAGWDGKGIDPFLPERLASEIMITSSERRLYKAWWASITGWLVGAKRAVLSGVAPDAAAIFTQAPAWAQSMQRFVDGPVRDTMGAVYRELFGKGFQFDARPAVVTHLAEVHNRLVRTTDEAFDMVAATVASGAAAGQSVDDIARGVEDVLTATRSEHWRGRAVTVARTETLSALNAGRTDSFEEIQATLGEDMERMWLTTLDGRARGTHVAADLQRVPLGTPFTVGGASLQYPGDPAGPAKEIVNCRCSTLLLKPGEEVDMSNRGFAGDELDEVDAEPVPDAEQQARDRQATIDTVRAGGSVAAEADRIVFDADGVLDDSSRRILDNRVNLWTAQGKIGAEVADTLRAALAGGDLARFVAAAWDHAESLGARRVGSAGDVVSFDRKTHQAIGGNLRSGQTVQIVQPGFRWADEDLLLERAVVEEATEAEVAEMQIRGALTGTKAAKSAPVGISGGRFEFRGADPGWSEEVLRRRYDHVIGYAGPGHESVNGWLRGTLQAQTAPRIFEAARKLMDAQIADIDAVIARSTLQNDIVVWRGVGPSNAFGHRIDGDLTGFTWTEEAYTSTSVRRELSDTFARRRGAGPGVLMRILLRRGTHGLDLGANEGEILLERGLDLRVVRDRGVVNGVRLVDVEVVRR